jgi:hypothetical protein
MTRCGCCGRLWQLVGGDVFSVSVSASLVFSAFRRMRILCLYSGRFVLLYGCVV